MGAALASLATVVLPLSCVDYKAVAECLKVLGPLSTATTELSQEKKWLFIQVHTNYSNDLTQNNG